MTKECELINKSAGLKVLQNRLVEMAVKTNKYLREDLTGNLTKEWEHVESRVLHIP
jgi:hypothetical protein